MRLPRAALVALLGLAACGSLEEGGALSGGASPSPIVIAPVAKRTLPPDDPSLKGCLADWAEGFTSLPPLVDRADVIVRAQTRSSRTTAERWGVGYRTTLEVERTFKGAPLTTLTVIESVCPVVYGGPTDWVLFLSPKLDETSVFQVAGGIQGAFPIKAGRVAPVYRDALIVRLYTGADVSELARDVASIRLIDSDAAAVLRSKGWTVAGKAFIRVYDLPPASEFGETRLPPRIERPFEGYAHISAVTGVDLRTFGGREVEEFTFFLERLPADGAPYPPTGRVIFVDRQYVGGWVQVDSSQVFRIEDRDQALAANPRPPAPPTPAPNRYPGGINVVAEYGLAQASSAYVKPLIPSAVRGVPAPPLKDLIAILDRTLRTEAAPPRRDDGYWVVGFVVGQHYVTFEYYPDADLLAQRDDGYAVHPGGSFRQLVVPASP
jgi:hypothetical protein